jgi:Fur family ferric uptake transcriptional regulator
MTHCHNLIDNLRQKGYRITPQRELIAESIAHSDYHLTAEQILELVQAHTSAINLATVYRTLDLLTAQGLVSRLDLGDGCIVYATAQHGPHIHLVCRLCGQVIDADYQVATSLKSQLVDQYHFQADLLHISIVGVCDSCQNEIVVSIPGG